MLTCLRDLTPGDIPSAMELSTAAGWNQIPEDWNRILRLSPRGCRCIEGAGEIVATTTLLGYGTDLAWVGMVLTRHEYRRKGLATRLIEDAIDGAERDGISTLKLDATEEGRPLYESLGFVVEGGVERWGRDGAACVSNEDTITSNLLSTEECQWGTRIPKELFALDLKAFGVSREQVLEELFLLGSSFTSGGYVVSRSGRVARSVGPCIAFSEAEAMRVVATHLDAQKEGTRTSEVCWYWDLLPANTAAVKCATALGFTRRRVLWRMRRGKPVQNNDALVFATAGFELG